MTIQFNTFVHEKTTFNTVELPEFAPNGADAWLRHDYVAANLPEQTLNLRTLNQESASFHIHGIPVTGMSFETLYAGDATDLFLRFVTGGDDQLVQINPGLQTVDIHFPVPTDRLDMAIFAESYSHTANVTADGFTFRTIPEPGIPILALVAAVILFCLRWRK